MILTGTDPSKLLTATQSKVQKNIKQLEKKKKINVNWFTVRLLICHLIKTELLKQVVTKYLVLVLFQQTLSRLQPAS